MADSQLASLSWCQATCRARDQFFFLLEIVFIHLRVCYFVASSLMRGLVCNLLHNCFWALPEQSLLGLSPAGLQIIFIVPILETPPPTWRTRSLYLHPPGTGWLRYTPRHWGPFPSSPISFHYIIELEIKVYVIQVENLFPGTTESHILKPF
jgi:hypothetical protein